MSDTTTKFGAVTNVTTTSSGDHLAMSAFTSSATTSVEYKAAPNTTSAFAKTLVVELSILMADPRVPANEKTKQEIQAIQAFIKENPEEGTKLAGTMQRLGKTNLMTAGANKKQSFTVTAKA